MSQEPRLRVAPRHADTLGDLAGDLAGDYELKPDEWQRIVLDDWLARKGGRWASLTCGLSVPRQNGKNALLEIRELFGMVGHGEKFLHTAHEVKTARKAFKRLQHFFGVKPDDPGAKFPELNALVTEVRNVNGQEAIFLRNGGSVEIVARSKNSGRGFTVDVLVCDEAQEMSDEDLEALMPTTSAAPLGNPQWIFTGTPPGPKANGEVFTRVRRDALGEKPGRVCWHEWSFSPDADLDDREEWRGANPATIPGRLQMSVIEGERKRFSDEGFARERGGVWSGDNTSGALSLARWLELKDAGAERGASPSFGVDIASDRAAWIAVAWRRPDGAAQVMLANGDVPLAAHRVAQEAARLSREWAGGVVSPPALIGDLFEAGIRADRITAADFAAACGVFVDMVDAGTVRHGNQPALNEAVKVAQWRSAGSQGERAFQLRDCPEIGPLAAVVRAVSGLRSADAGVWEWDDLDDGPDELADLMAETEPDDEEDA